MDSFERTPRFATVVIPHDDKLRATIIDRKNICRRGGEREGEEGEVEEGRRERGKSISRNHFVEWFFVENTNITHAEKYLTCICRYM